MPPIHLFGIDSTMDTNVNVCNVLFLLYIFYINMDSILYIIYIVYIIYFFSAVSDILLVSVMNNSMGGTRNATKVLY